VNGLFCSLDSLYQSFRRVLSAVLGDLGTVSRRLLAGPGIGFSIAALVLLREVDPFCAMIADLGIYVVKKWSLGVTRLELLVTVLYTLGWE
jgi:hypothetical protein